MGRGQQGRNLEKPSSAVVGFRQVADFPGHPMSCGSVVGGRRQVQLYVQIH